MKINENLSFDLSISPKCGRVIQNQACHKTDEVFAKALNRQCLRISSAKWSSWPFQTWSFPSFDSSPVQVLGRRSCEAGGILEFHQRNLSKKIAKNSVFSVSRTSSRDFLVLMTRFFCDLQYGSIGFGDLGRIFL